MKRNALLCTALLAACGGGNKNTTPAGELGTGTHDTGDKTEHVVTQPEKSDPAKEFRLGYSDPGGMWMPAQMSLPQHVDTFKKMGTKLDATALTDPLKEPLAAVVWLGGHALIDGRLTAGSLTQFFLYTFMVAGTLSDLSSLWGSLQRAAGATDRLFALIDTVPEIEEPATPAKLPAGGGAVRFDNVSFAYPSRKAQPVLTDVSLDVKPGEVVALVGTSGAGIVQQVQNDLSHPSGAVNGEEYIFLSRFIQRVAVFFFELGKKARHHPKRLLQVMRRHIGELLQICVGSGQHPEAVLQFFVELPELLFGELPFGDIAQGADHPDGFAG